MSKEFKSVMFRVDGSSYIGVGHVMRCLTLAEYFFGLGFNVDFFCINYESSILKKIKNKGFNLVNLPDINIERLSDLAPSSDAIQVLDARNCINEITDKYRFIFVDNYRLGFAWECEIKSYCHKLIVIDDLANRQHFCDFLIDQNFGRNKNDYCDLVKIDTKLMLGLDYVILRKEFNLFIEKSIIKRRKTEKINTIFICFGGGNTTNLVMQALDVLIESGFLGCIHVAISSSSSGLNELIKKYHDNKHILIEIDIHSIPLAMYEADLSIGAFGSMSWERCCLGLPSISIKIAENQKYISDVLERLGVTMKSDISGIPDCIQSLYDGLNVSNRWHALSNRSFELCDARGVERIYSEINRTK